MTWRLNYFTNSFVDIAGYNTLLTLNTFGQKLYFASELMIELRMKLMN